jgi:hypothetical protein
VEDAVTSEQPELFLFDGATEVTGWRQLLWILWHWRWLRRDMRTAPGYVAHRVWWGFPFTIGLITWWESEAAAYRFARGPAHLYFWNWGMDPDHTAGGWLADYRYVRGGALWGNGVQDMMRRLGGRTGPASGQPARRPAERRR